MSINKYGGYLQVSISAAMSVEEISLRVYSLLVHEVEISFDVNKRDNDCFFRATKAVIHVAKILSYGKCRSNIPIIGCRQN